MELQIGFTSFPPINTLGHIPASSGPDMRLGNSAHNSTKSKGIIVMLKMRISSKDIFLQSARNRTWRLIHKIVDTLVTVDINPRDGALFLGFLEVAQPRLCVGQSCLGMVRPRRKVLKEKKVPG